jgi:hypothetical protein
MAELANIKFGRLEDFRSENIPEIATKVDARRPVFPASRAIR